MAYTETHLTTLAHLKALAEKTAALQETVNGIVSTGGEANVIETVKVNGTALTVTDKAVDVTVPTSVSELTNDSDYQTAAEVAEAIAAAGHASFQVADSVPSESEAESNVLYLVMNSDTGYYDIYALVSGSVVLLDDTTIDLTGYATTSALSEYVTATVMTEALADYILSSEIASDTEVTEMLTELFSE